MMYKATSKVFRRRSGPPVLFLCAFLMLAGPGAIAAIDPLDFDSVEQQRQYRDLIGEFRCPKCLNQNLAESDAPIAQDLRLAVYELVQEGRSSDEIRRFMQERYGDFVLYNPPLRADTLLLWFGPLALALVGLGVVWRISRRRGSAESIELDDDARAQVRAMLGGNAGPEGASPDAGRPRQEGTP
jgi:cytochrome c-type biogenesis protein CcmH